jgi:hypothetical protein
MGFMRGLEEAHLFEKATNLNQICRLLR